MIKSKSWFVFLIIIAVILLLIFLNIKEFLSEVKSIFFRISFPFLNFFQVLANKISDFGQSFLEIKDLKNKNEILLRENLELKSEIVKLKEVLRENEILKKQFEIFSTKEEQIFAKIRGFDQKRTTILLDKGEKEGILKDMPVTGFGNVLLGKIVELGPNFSKALLLNDSRSQVAAMTQEERAKGILRGRDFKSYLVLEMIQKDEEIKVGDKIITSGLDAIFPKGIFIGEVAEVLKSDVEPFQAALVKPAVDFEDLEEVFIIKVTNN